MKKSRFGWLECIVGALMILLGIFTLIRPSSVINGFTRVYAIMAIISGVRDIVFYCRAEKYTGFRPVLSLTSSIISLMAGVMLFVYPSAGVMILSLIVPIWFISHSIFQIASLDRVKYLTSSFHYYFSLVMSVIGLILSIMMLFNPLASVITVSTVVGFYLIVTGITSIVLAFSKTGFGKGSI